MAINKGIVGIGDAGGSVVASDNFNVQLYTGTGTTGEVITTGLAADLVIIKCRSLNRNGTSSQQDWIWFDTIRGPSEYIRSNRGDSPQYYAGSGKGVSAFGSTTVTIGDDPLGSTGANGLAPNGQYSGASLYTMYSFTGGGTAVTIAANTVGNTIASDVSANVAAGFSIVNYTGNGTSGATFGHGLDSAPELIIQKNVDEAQSWIVNADAIGKSNVLTLSSTGGILSRPNQYYYAWDSSTITTGSDIHTNGLNDEIVAYCFHSVAGYSKIDTYLGSGLSGKTIATGFEPAFVMIKASSTTGHWYVFDNKRKTGVYSDQLMMNSISAEITGTNVKLTSTGFTLDTTADDLNNGGVTFLYMAFAE
tara:strand:- start:25 stop:1113 length:1089 start_codon:yes stop_codon:yes gene_type:complete